MEFNSDKVKTITTPNGGKLEIRTFVINFDKNNPDSLRQAVREMLEKTRKQMEGLDAIRTTIHYEFYDENDDWHEDQNELGKLLGLNFNNLKYNTVHTLQEIEDLVNYRISGGKEKLDQMLIKKVDEAGRGKYEYLDTYAYYEARESYYMVYLQYKIKKLQ